MKKLLALTLALSMLLSFAACGGAVSDSSGDVAPATEKNTSEPNPAIVKYIEENKDELDDGMTAEAVGNGIVFTAQDESLDELDEDGIDMIKSMFQETVDELLAEAQAEVPEIEWIEMKFLNSEGDEVFSLTSEGKAAPADDEEDVDDEAEEDEDAPNPALVKFVEENGGDLEDGMTIEVEGNGLVFNFVSGDLDLATDEILEEVKNQYQEQVDALFDEAQAEVPELEWIEMRFYNSDEDLVFTLSAGK